MANKKPTKTTAPTRVAVRKPAIVPVEKPAKNAGGKKEPRGFAIAGMVLTFFVSILGLVFGSLALHRGKKYNESYNKRLGTASVVLSSIFTAFEIYMIVYYLINGTLK